MYQRIYESLNRQDRALEVLRDLLAEEYDIMLQRDTDQAIALEFSTQELIRQLAAEKTMVIELLGGMRVLQYAATLDEEQGDALLALYSRIDVGEQAASRMAARNAQLSLALLDQSSRTLQGLTSHAIRFKSEVYGRRGGMINATHPAAAIISGRL